ncbi:MAG: hypothetical protein A2W28_05165 [Gammaproteobacteria bacterium RBG_16_51_14]|nr:MAG: hypothetical protein A2W28_05165 [Gammaproteobacteria bacterium RBG_16_51_14]
MHKKIFLMVFLAGMVAFTVASRADPVTISSGDTIQKVLSAQTGKKVSVIIKSGEELTGTVTTVTDELTHLGELAGKEFYDAIVVNSNIAAIIVRVK